MRVLFMHPNFPAQFRHVATVLGREPGNQLIFLTKTRNDWEIPGVTKAYYAPARDPKPETHHYLRGLEAAVLQGQAAYRSCEELKRRGFYPDLVYAHSGWGPSLYVKDVFPRAPFLSYFEWYYQPTGSDADFDPSEPLTADDYPRIRTKNTSILLDIANCDWGISPTYWQRSQFPLLFQKKIAVLHDGVDTDYFAPKPGAKLVLPDKNLDLSEVTELVTYVARGMEPYRGFPQFIEMLGILQKRRPNVHAVIVGENRVCYGKAAPAGTTYKEMMLAKVPLDMSRVHFTGPLPYGQYLQVIQASSVHVYLTRPFVLSWSMIEALSTGCVVLGSDTGPVREVITDGVNGLLVDFFDVERIADRVEEVLDNPEAMIPIRQKARETVLTRYAHAQLLPQHLQLMQDVANWRLPPAAQDTDYVPPPVVLPTERAATPKPAPKPEKKAKGKKKGFAEF